MKYFKFILVSIFFITLSCGYTPVLVNKNFDFSFKDVELLGDKKISKSIQEKINFLYNKDGDYEILINSSEDRTVSSKDKKGNPELFNMFIKVEISIINNNTKVTRIFNERVNYNNQSSKFKLKQKEDSIKKKLINKVSEEILTFIQSI